MKRAFIRVSAENPLSEELKGCFAQIFSALDADPKEMLVKLFPVGGTGGSIDFDNSGRLLFSLSDNSPTVANFRGRWLAEHPVPLKLHPFSASNFIFKPTTGNRVKVRQISRMRAFLENLKYKWSKK